MNGSFIRLISLIKSSKSPAEVAKSNKQWVRTFFTAFLIRKTENSYLQYTKRKLNPVYLQKQEKDIICGKIENIENIEL